MAARVAVRRLGGAMMVAAYTAEAIARSAVVPARRWATVFAGWRAVAVLLAGVTGALMVAPSTGYDASWHLAWGQEIWAGRRPDGAALAAPTAHPLLLVVSTALAPLGADAAAAVLTVLVGLALGAIVLAIGSVARSLDLPPAAATLAGVLAATSPELLRSASVLGSDVFVLALTATAAASLPRGRHGVALALLTTASTLRPEGWLLVGALATWLVARRPGTADRRQILAALAVAPAAWGATGWLVAGDPAHGLTGTRELAAALDRPTGLGDAATRFGPDLLAVAGSLTGLAGLVAGAIVLQRARDRRAVLALPIAFGAAAWLALGIAGLPLVQRYLLLPGTALVVLACALPTVAPRRLGLAVLAALVLVDGGLRVATALDARTAAAAARAEREAVGALRLTECDAVAVTQARLIPDVALAAHLPLSRVALGAGDVTVVVTGRAARSAVLAAPVPASGRPSTPTTTAGPYARYGTC